MASKSAMLMQRSNPARTVLLRIDGRRWVAMEDPGGKMEAAPGFEPGNKGFADPRLTTWLCRLEEIGAKSYSAPAGEIPDPRVRKTLALQGERASRNVPRFLGVWPAAMTPGGGVLPIHGVTGLALSIGSRLGPYEILAALGAGGLGEVYRG